MSGGQLSMLGEDEVASITKQLTDSFHQQIASIQTKLTDSFTSDLTAVFRDIMRKELPKVLSDTDLFREIMHKELPKILIDVKDEMIRIESAKQDARAYMNSNPEKFNTSYNNRKKLFDGYWRCESLTKLYEECKSSTPAYIPRKFRDDKFFVRDEEELAIVNVRFMGKFDSEYNLLKKRQRDFATAINAEDDVIYELIEHCNAPDVVKTEIAAIWERDVKSEEDKTKEDWRKKVTGMKAAYEKDKKNLEELNQQRKAKFQKLRQGTRRVEFNNETNRVLVSIGSFSIDSEEEGEEDESAPLQEQPATEPAVTVHTEQTGISTDTAHGNAPEPPVQNEPSNDTVDNNLEPAIDVENRTTPRSEGVSVVETTPDVTTTGDDASEEVINSSAPLFGTQNNSDDNVFSSQTQENIEQMARNFSTPPVQQHKMPRHNYKFRKRDLLK